MVGKLSNQFLPDDEEDPISPRLRGVFNDLLQAHWYSANTGVSRWEFAISISELKEVGLKLSDLRWLVKRGFVNHAREVTAYGDDGREFRSTGDLTFHENTCVILTDSGVRKAQSLQVLTVVRPSFPRSEPADPRLQTPKPSWNSMTRELKFDGKLVKRFKWHAENQELILDAFEEEGWPVVIHDPLPPKHDQDCKLRVQETIKALNRHHDTAGLIRFRGNGTADGVRWECACKVDNELS